MHRTLRRVRGTRKQMRRGLKRARSLFKRLRRAQKSFYFRLRDSEAGRVLLRAASRALAPREVRHRREAASPYIARLERSGAPAIDPDKGYRLLSAEPARELSEALASCRRLFEIKKAEFDARFAGFDTWSPDWQEKYLSRKRSFLRYLLDDEDLRQHPELVEFSLGDATLGAATRYLGMVPYLSRVDLMYSLAHGAARRESGDRSHVHRQAVLGRRHPLAVQHAPANREACPGPSCRSGRVLTLTVGLTSRRMPSSSRRHHAKPTCVASASCRGSGRAETPWPPVSSRAVKPCRS